MLAGSSARAQQPSERPIGREVALLHLGGDSAQVALVSLLAGAPYRLEITPATAEVLVRRRAVPPEPPIRVALLGTTDSSRTHAFMSLHRGEYLIELTNPQRAARIRVIHEGAGTQVSEAASRAMFEPELRIFDQDFPGPRRAVALGADVVYRVEIRSNGPVSGGIVSLHSVSNLGQPRIQAPLSDPLEGQGVSVLVIPTVSDEYWVDVSGSAQVRIAIIRDPKETARWARMSDQTRNLPRAGISVRAVHIGAFPRPGARTDYASGSGMDICLGLVARGAWVGGDVGGCALSVSFYRRSHEATVAAIGIAPRVLLSPATARWQFALGASFALAATTESPAEQSYWMFGVAVIAERMLLRRLLVEAEIGVMHAQTTANRDARVLPRSSAPHRLALGLQYRL